MLKATQENLSYEEVEKKVLKKDISNNILKLLIQLAYISYKVPTFAHSQLGTSFGVTFLKKNDYMNSQYTLYPHTLELIRKWNPLTIPFTMNSLKWLHTYLGYPSKYHKRKLMKLGILNEFGMVESHVKEFFEKYTVEDVLCRTKEGKGNTKVAKRKKEKIIYSYNEVRSFLVEGFNDARKKIQEIAGLKKKEVPVKDSGYEIEKIISYRTADGAIFKNEADASRRSEALKVLRKIGQKAPGTDEIRLVESLLKEFSICEKG